MRAESLLCWTDFTIITGGYESLNTLGVYLYKPLSCFHSFIHLNNLVYHFRGCWSLSCCWVKAVYTLNFIYRKEKRGEKDVRGTKVGGKKGVEEVGGEFMLVDVS